MHKIYKVCIIFYVLSCHRILLKYEVNIAYLAVMLNVYNIEVDLHHAKDKDV